MGNLLIHLPLIIALVALVIKARKGLKAGDSVRAAMKAIAYIAAAATLLLVFAPTLGTVGTVFGLILTTVFAVLNVLAVVDLPSNLDRVDDLLWRDWKKTPLYSRSGNPVPYVRWARRFTMAALVVYVVICGLVSAIVTDSSSSTSDDKIVAAPPAATSTPAAAPIAPATAAPSAPATSAPSSDASQEVKNECGGLNPKKLSKPAEINFKVDKLFICKDGEWLTWDQVNPNTAAPTKASLTAWTVDGGKKNGYGVIAVGNTSYLFWTTAITW